MKFIKLKTVFQVGEKMEERDTVYVNTEKIKSITQKENCIYLNYDEAGDYIMVKETPEIVEMIKGSEITKEIEITDVSDKQKFIRFRVKGLEDGIIVGLTHPDLALDDPKQGLSVGYRGEVKKIEFKQKSLDI